MYLLEIGGVVYGRRRNGDGWPVDRRDMVTDRLGTWTLEGALREAVRGPGWSAAPVNVVRAEHGGVWTTAVRDVGRRPGLVKVDAFNGRVTFLGTGISTLAGARRELRRRHNQGQPEPVMSRPGARFYVTARLGRRTQVLLFGPYSSHMTALAHVGRARTRVVREPFGAWVPTGTCSLMTSEQTSYGR